MDTDKIFALLSREEGYFYRSRRDNTCKVNCVVVTKDQGTNNWEAESQDQS